MASFTFYPYKKTNSTKIYLRLRNGRETDIRVSTGLTIEDAKTWNYNLNLPKKNSEKNKVLYRRLIALQESIEDEFDKLEKSENHSVRDINSKLVKGVIQKFNNLEPLNDLDLLSVYAKKFAESLKNKTYTKNGIQYNYTKNTINKYLNFAVVLKSYEDFYQKEIKISDVDKSFAFHFLDYLTTELNRSINTKGRFIKRLKTIVKDAEINGIKTNKEYNLIKGFEDESIVTYLTFDEIDDIIQTQMPNERLDIAKDWLIISCYTAQRISDLQRFTKKNIQKIDGGRYICLKQFKTNKSIEVPIHFHVERILEKYNGNFPPKFSENHQSNRSTLSTLIKDVCKISGITEKVKGRFNGKKGIYPKFQLISNHSGRRSFACNFYNLPEWSNAMIMNITGHENEKNFYKYIDKEDKTLSRKGRELFDSMELESKNQIIKPKLKKAN